jgi:hypothetical protein
MQQVHVHKVGRKTNKLGPADYLEAPEILPGFRMEIRHFFE